MKKALEITKYNVGKCPECGNEMVEVIATVYASRDYEVPTPFITCLKCRKKRVEK